MIRLCAICSGGQDGADLGGLKMGVGVGLNTKGFMPKGWRTESGPHPEYEELYNMTEHSSPEYPPRTMANVDFSEATVAFLWGRSVGTMKTIGYARTHKWVPHTESLLSGGYRPVLVITTRKVEEAAQQLHLFLESTQARILNVAGHRESSQPGIQDFVEAALLLAIDIEMDKEG